MLADGLIKGGIDRIPLHWVSRECPFKFAHPALTHVKTSVGSTIKSAEADAAEKQQ